VDVDQVGSSASAPAASEAAGEVEYAPDGSVVPRPRRQRLGVALCLSGGGFRAAMFHLGAMRRLNELGVLARVTTISSVSGGSILAGLLAKEIGADWPSNGQFADWARVEERMRAFCCKNIRTMPILVGALPWNLLNSAKPVQELIDRYREDLNSGLLRDLPRVGPKYIFCATDMSYGVNWIFSAERIGSYQAGYLYNPDARFDVATAVGASSCFPPVFDPWPITVRPGELSDGDDRSDERAERVRGLRLADGGLYDNLGLEPVWRTHEYVLVSDGGSTFDAQGDGGLFWRLNRYVGVMGKQVGSLRKRWLIASFEDPDPDRALFGTYWGIGTFTRSYARRGETPVRGYGDDLVDEYISEVRTDLDRFSESEMDALINHGYLLAEAATARYTPDLRDDAPPPLRVPYEALMEPEALMRELRNSHKRKLPFGRR